MEGLRQILILVAFLASGAFLVKLRLAPRPRRVDCCIKGALWALLFAMGFRIGNDAELVSGLGRLGLLACATALVSVGGTILAIQAAWLLIPSFAGSVPVDAGKADRAMPLHGAPVSLKAPLVLLAVVCLGFVAGILAPRIKIDSSAVSGWILNILLFFIGMQFAQSGIAFRKAFLNPAAIITPVATALGTLAGGLVLAPIFHLSIGKSLTLSGGFGWYSLSGVLLSNLGDPALGSASFLANMARETIALLTIPFLARSRIPYLAVGVGGATSMDVTLPLIEQSAGPWIVPVSFVSGALLSLSVPILIPLLFRAG